MINKITWTLFDSKIEEEIYYESDEYFDTEADIYSISDLVSEVFCVTQFKEIKNNMDISVDTQDEQINKLQEFSKKLNEFMKYAKEIIRDFIKSFNELNALKKNEALEELIINYYDDIENNNSLKIQEIEKNILKNIENEASRNEVEKIFNEKNNDKYYVLINILRYIGELYEERYNKYKLLKQMPKKNYADATLWDLPKILMSDYFGEYYKIQLRHRIEFYQDKQKEYCSININEISSYPINDLLVHIKNYNDKNSKNDNNFSKNYGDGSRCFALADIKLNGIHKEIIAFSGLFDSEHQYIIDIYELNTNKFFQSLLEAINAIKGSNRFKHSILIKTELYTKYYGSDKSYIELNEAINFLKNTNIQYKNKENPILYFKRMFSCCEGKILSSYPTIDKIYVKKQPCCICVRALEYNNIDDNNVFYIQPDSKNLENKKINHSESIKDIIREYFVNLIKNKDYNLDDFDRFINLNKL